MGCKLEEKSNVFYNKRSLHTHTHTHKHKKGLISRGGVEKKSENAGRYIGRNAPFHLQHILTAKKIPQFSIDAILLNGRKCRYNRLYFLGSQYSDVAEENNIALEIPAKEKSNKDGKGNSKSN